MIRLVDGACAKVAIAPLHGGFVLLRRALALIVGGKFGAAVAHDLHRVTAIRIELRDALRIGSIELDSAAIGKNIVH
jgi:hypothetical protein